MKVLVPSPVSFEADTFEPHPNCRCTMCDPVYVPGLFTAVENALDREPGRADMIGKAEARAGFDIGRDERTVVAAVPGSSSERVYLNIDASKFSFDMDAVTLALASSNIGLDSQVVRAAARLAADELEERVRYAMVTGHEPPPKANRAALKAALDYYLATGGEVPQLAAQAPAAPGRPVPSLRQGRPAHRRAMRLRGRLEVTE